MSHASPVPGETPGPAGVQHTRAAHARLTRKAALSRLSRMPADAHLYPADLAALVNVAPSTIKHYMLLARYARAEAEPPAAPSRLLPEPDDYDPGVKDPARDRGIGGNPRPFWYPATIRPWIARRQPPGRPRKNGAAPRRLKLDPAKPGPKPRTTD
jgi:hypothetical protein